MRILDLALKDLAQVLRDKRSALFLVIMPIVFTAFMGFAFSGATKQDERLPIALVSHEPDGVVSKNLLALMQESQTVRLVNVADEAQAEQQVQKGDLAGALIVPAGFSDRTLAGETVKLTLIADPAHPAAQTARQAVQAIFMRAMSIVEIGRLTVQLIGPGGDDLSQQIVLTRAMEAASAAWQNPQLSVTLEKAYPAKTTTLTNPFTQSSPGMIVMFAIFGLITSAMILVTERKSRTLQRLLTTGMSRPAIIAGHILAMFVIVFLQELLLVLIGQLAFGVNYMREPAGTIAVMVALAFWAASLGLLIGTVAKGEEQVVLYSLIAMFALSALGGAWFPLETVGAAFSAVAHVLPSAWAMEGFQNIVVRQLALGSVLLPVAILLAYALGFFGVAVWRFQPE